LVARAQVRAWLRQRLPEVLEQPEVLPAYDDEPAAAAGDWPDLEALLAAYPALLAPALRKRRGAWYTPPALALATAQRTLAPLLRNGPRPLRLVDPAVGGGAFLLAAFAVLRAAGWAPRDAAGCLHGVDLDDTIATLTALAIFSTLAGNLLLIGSLANIITAERAAQKATKQSTRSGSLRTASTFTEASTINRAFGRAEKPSGTSGTPNARQHSGRG
jgi:hypothetical protein